MANQIVQIRRNSNEDWNWVDYDEYLPLHPELREAVPKKTVATCAFLRAADDSMIMPLNRVERFFAEGPKLSTRSFAETLGRLVDPR